VEVVVVVVVVVEVVVVAVAAAAAAVDGLNYYQYFHIMQYNIHCILSRCIYFTL
jgi:hypothetical protein